MPLNNPNPAPDPTRSSSSRHQHIRSNSLASRLANNPQPSSSRLPTLPLNTNLSSQPMSKKSQSAGPVIYPPKTNFDAIRGRFGLNPSPTNSPINTRPGPAGSLSIYRRDSTGHQKRFSTSDFMASQPAPPVFSASSLMTNASSGLGLERSSSASRRPFSVIEPGTRLNMANFNLPSNITHDGKLRDRGLLERVSENGSEPTSFPYRRAHSSNPAHPEADQLIPVGQVEDVVGMHGRLRLSRGLPQSPVATSRLTGSLKLLESQRHLLQAYEYLCHVGEAKDWLEAVLLMASIDDPIPAASLVLPAPPPSSPSPSPLTMNVLENNLHQLSVTEFEQALRDGVILARLARRFMGPEGVPRIYINPKLVYRHSDNINYFFRFVRSVGLPELFIFELVDLYNAKNLPKVIYCIHVLSHLLAKRGMAERIGNLIGKLEFSNDQLEQTNAGLVGKNMPNFGNINKELAKEINEEPEVEVESEADRVVRELDEVLPEVVGLQSQLRGHLARLEYEALLNTLSHNRPITVALQAAVRGHLQRSSRVQLAETLWTNSEAIVGFQAILRGVRCRRKCRAALKLRKELDIWAMALQAAIRSRLAQRRFSKHKMLLAKLSLLWTALQALARGSLVRARRSRVIASASQSERAFIGVQALVRARLMTQGVQERKKRLESVEIASSVVELQARIRGLLGRRRFFEPIHRLDVHESAMVRFQSLVRTRLVRVRLSKMVSELMASEQDATSFQAACRGALSRRGLFGFIQALQDCEPSIIDLQARCRASVVRRAYKQKARALNKIEVTRGVGGLQAFVRAGLIRKKIVNQKKELDFIQPDVVGIQAQCRGLLARLEWGSWFDHVRRSVGSAVFLQSLTRGFLVRREFFERLMHYENEMDKVIKVQSVYRARQQASQYKHLTRRTNVPMSAIKTFLHLLSDSDVDYEEEIELAKLRTEVVRLIRDNQQLDAHVNELDTKIALLVKNKITLDEVQRASGSGGGGRRRQNGGYRNSILAAANDPFASVNLLDKSSKRKLELYQQMFYLLQTKPEYLARLFYLLKEQQQHQEREREREGEKVKKLVEGVVLTLFGYAQMRREEFLLLKLFQRSIHEELAGVSSLSEFITGKFTFVNLLIQYGRGAKEKRYLKDMLSPVICEIAQDRSMNLETDPIKIYRSVINEEETRTGIQSSRPIDVSFNEALADQETLALFIEHLQSLRALTDRFLYAMSQSTKRMPFGIRYIAREIFRGLQVKFPNESEDALGKVVLHMIYYRYLQPAVVAPETYDVVDSLINPLARKNLSEASKMLNQISVGRLFSDENPYLVPLNEYVSHAAEVFTSWLFALVDVEDAESHFAVDEYLDHIVATKPTIYISPNEIYATHSLVLRDLDRIAPGKDDPLRSVLVELGVAPTAASAELDQARAGEIALHLENKLAIKQDPEADVKALWVKTKRYVLAMLKVQPGASLLDAFLAPVTEEHEEEWARIVTEEIEFEKHRHRVSRAIAASSDSGHMGQTLEDVHCLSFQELKARTLENVLALERRGKLVREDNYQGILDSLASDILQRNRRRIQRRGDMSQLVNTLANLKDKQRYLEDQESQYHSYIADSMASMQKKGVKKKFVMPFTPQWHHVRALEKEGRKPKFGSYKYSAQRLYEKGILLSIDRFSPKQFDKLSLIISCDEVGVFKLEARFNESPIESGSVEVRMEDLLEEQFSGKQSVCCGEIGKMNLNLLLHLIKSVCLFSFSG